MSSTDTQKKLILELSTTGDRPPRGTYSVNYKPDLEADQHRITSILTRAVDGLDFGAYVHFMGYRLGDAIRRMAASYDDPEIAFTILRNHADAESTRLNP